MAVLGAVGLALTPPAAGTAGGFTKAGGLTGSFQVPACFGMAAALLPSAFPYCQLYLLVL